MHASDVEEYGPNVWRALIGDPASCKKWHFSADTETRALCVSRVCLWRCGRRVRLCTMRRAVLALAACTSTALMPPVGPRRADVALRAERVNYYNSLTQAEKLDQLGRCRFMERSGWAGVPNHFSPS